MSKSKVRRRGKLVDLAPAPPEQSNYSTVEAAAWLRLDPQTLMRWRRLGTGPVYSKLGGRVVYSISALRGFMKRYERASTTAGRQNAR